MTRVAAGVVIGLALVVLLITGVSWFVHMIRLTDTYDERFRICMEVEKSYQPGYVIPFPSPAWDRATAKCEQEANR